MLCHFANTKLDLNDFFFYGVLSPSYYINDMIIFVVKFYGI